MLVKLWKCFKQVEARQSELAMRSAVSETDEQEINAQGNDDDALIASLMRPRNQMISVKEMTGQNDPNSLGANAKTAEALAASNKAASSSYSPRGPGSSTKQTFEPNILI